MKFWMGIMCAVGLTACSSQEATTWYQLPENEATSVGVTATTGAQRLLWVDQVTVPDFLAGNGVAYQTSDVKYTIAKQHLWASPLDQQLRDTLVANLAGALPGWIVSARPLGHDQDVISVTISGFHGRYDGHVVVKGEWLLNHQGTYSRQSFSVVLPQQGDGYGPMVKALGDAWHQEAMSMVTRIRNGR